METRQDIFKLDENLYRLVQTDSNDKFVDSYLVIGDSSALLIDAQREKGSLLSTVKSLTDKPLQLVLTHAHIDHFGPNMTEILEAGIKTWIFREETEIYKGTAFEYPYECSRKYEINDLAEDMVFDLGGIRLEVSGLPGHTPMGCMLLEREKGWLFSGDAFGNKSFWMQVDGAEKLSKAAYGIEKYLEKLKSVKGLKIYTGHGIEYSYYERDWAEDVLSLSKDIISGKITGQYVEGVRWPDTYCYICDTFPEGFFYRSTGIN